MTPTSPEGSDPYAELKDTHREIRAQLSKFYEQLALLDGGTIALATTTVLGRPVDQFKHRYTLALGLGFLSFALIAFLIRALADSGRAGAMNQWQFHLKTADIIVANQRSKSSVDRYTKWTKTFEVGGIVCTILGLSLLAFVLIWSIVV